MAVFLSGCTATPDTGPVAARPDLAAAFAALDAAYIPAIVLTGEGTPKASREALQSLVDQWQAFKQQIAHRPMAKRHVDHLWNADQRILAARGAVENGKVQKAHEELGKVGQIMLRLRQKLGISYFIDHLIRFHDPMERIVETTRNKTPVELTAQDIKLIQDELSAARKRWEEIVQAEFSPGLFGFGVEELAQKDALVDLEAARLRELEAALDAGDREAIIEAAAAIKPPFAKLFKLFGDFPGKRSGSAR
jgi:flagellin-specific chaperone FliS